ncbi:SDR family oxidoreductase [Actinomycetospora endophytica]|uniref:SDR family oxidoreductase n=1 Tax=Actinomycetospora endophytica TaxID=2291215 RepID=A0ABS8P221_9PSEU|nr:SDR family oxidoreductase [Actinomycetospora endophytica]MCD2192269.1 SDR family oxidoreductase [Actinomycetospora endophytica]
MSAVLFTGFPGFLGSSLLPRTLRREPDARAVALVQQRWLGRAREALNAIERDDPSIAGRTDLVVGDITTPGLGLDDAVRARLLDGPLEIFHLAAVYDLSVAPEIAWRVNVEGTRHVVDLARAAADGAGLRRLQYVSTCYVSGRYDGLFFEDDLEIGQRFANHYDHTKHEAERVVAKARDAGLPVTIYRPSVVVGDSVTGRTQKFDGPYYVLQLLLRQRGTALMPLPRGAARVAFNLVPSDFVVDGIAALAGYDGARGRTVALAQPDPPSVTRMCEAFAEQAGLRLRTVPMATGLAAFGIDHVPGVGRLFKVPSSTLEYLTHPTLYDTTATTTLLAEVGVRCPSFAEHVGPMVEFFRAHPDIGSAAMV